MPTVPLSLSEPKGNWGCSACPNESVRMTAHGKLAPNIGGFLFACHLGRHASRHPVGQVTLERVRCSCKSGQEEVSRFCNLGRRCGVLKVDDDNVCSLLIDERLARPFVCGEERCPKRKPW